MSGFTLFLRASARRAFHLHSYPSEWRRQFEASSSENSLMSTASPCTGTRSAIEDLVIGIADLPTQVCKPRFMWRIIS